MKRKMIGVMAVIFVSLPILLPTAYLSWKLEKVHQNQQLRLTAGAQPVVKRCPGAPPKYAHKDLL